VSEYSINRERVRHTTQATGEVIASDSVLPSAPAPFHRTVTSEANARQTTEIGPTGVADLGKIVVKGTEVELTIHAHCFFPCPIRPHAASLVEFNSFQRTGPLAPFDATGTEAEDGSRDTGIKVARERN